jgi:ribose transport system substrate-binding protein
MKKKCAGLMMHVAAALALVMAAASCSPASAGEKELFVGFSAGYQLVQHWNLEINGCKEAVEAAGGKFTYTVADGNEQQQVADVENMVQMGINMLIIGPCNSEGIVPTIEELKRKGIPVMTSDIGVTGTEVTAHVASDNYQIGVMAAEYMAKELGGKGKIALITWPAASATADREKGFVDTIKKYSDITIVANQDAGSVRAKALEVSESIILANKDIVAVFGCNAESALGAYAATLSLDRSDILVVSVDTDSEVMAAIASGSNLKATIAQDPYKMGYQAGATAIKHLRGESVSSQAIGSELVTKDNVQKIIDRDTAHLPK